MRWRPTAAQLTVLSAAALLFLFCEGKQLAMNDLGIYLAMGREMAEQGGIADVDGFTHTVDGARFLNGTWGSQLLFFHLWRMGGYGALQLLLAFSVCATVVTAALGARRAAKGSDPALGFGALLSAWLVVQNLGLRPQLFSLPLFAGYAALALSCRPSWLTIALSAAIVALWANLHGSFVIAPILSLLVAAGVLWETLPAGANPVRHAIETMKTRSEAFGHSLTAGAALLAGALNPYGIGIYTYVAENSSSPSARGLTEWFPTSIGSPQGIRVVVAAVLIGLAFWRSRRSFAKRDLPALGAFLFLALTAVRHVVWLGMIVPIAVARAFPAREGEEPKRYPAAVGWVAVAIWGAFLAAESPLLHARATTEDAEVRARFTKDTPVDLATWCAGNGVRGKLFNSMEWGSYLAWRLPPEAKLFVDVRIWIYPDPVWNEYLEVSKAVHGWEEILDRHEVEWAILEKRFHWQLLPYIAESPLWEKAYEDDLGLVYRRTTHE